MESVEKLRTAGRNMAKGRNLEHHEDCNLLLIIADEIEREIAERYQLLPVDADGVPIHVGDRMVGDCPSGKHVCGDVSAVCDGWFLLDNVSFKLRGEYMHHVKPDPLKELLDDVSKGIICYPRERVTGYLEDNNNISEAVMLDVRDRLRDLLGGERR